MNENEQMNAPVEPNNNINMNYTQTNFQPKKKNSMIWLVPVILILAVAAVAVVWFMNLNKPEKMYRNAIETAFDTYTEQLVTINDMKSYKANMNLDVDIDLEEEIDNEEILDLINNTAVGLGVQLDKENKKAVVDLKADYDDEQLLDLKVFADIEDKKAYLYAKEYLDKYLEVEIDEDEFGDLEELLETEKLSLGESKKIEAAMNIMKKEFVNVVKSEYCSAEKSKQKINGKEINTTKNTFEMTIEEMANEFATVFGNLEENEEFLNLIEEDLRKDMKKILKEARKSMEELAEEDGVDEGKIQINTYTTGFMPSVVKTEVLVLNEDDELLAVVITKNDEEKYTLELRVEEEDVIELALTLTNVSKNGANIIAEAEIEDLGSFKVELGYSEEYNKKIEKVDTKKAVNIEDLTEDEQTELMENLEDSKLYELVEEFSEIAAPTPSMPSVDIDDITPPTITTSSLEDNQILTYDSKTKVTFGIPAGYEADRISDTYQTIENDDVDITITSNWTSEDEFYESLKEVKETKLKQTYNKSVILSEKQSKTIAGKTIYLATMEIEDDYGKYTLAYAWAKVDESNVVEFIINGFEEMTSSELDQLLTITSTKN